MRWNDAHAVCVAPCVLVTTIARNRYREYESNQPVRRGSVAPAAHTEQHTMERTAGCWENNACAALYQLVPLQLLNRYGALFN